MRCLKYRVLLSVFLLFGLTSFAAASQSTNFLGIQLVNIPAGSFEMGSCKITDGMHKENRKRIFLGLPALDPGCGTLEENINVNDNETPRHTVNIQTFKMAIMPVTVGQYKKYLDAIGEIHNKDDWGLYSEEFKRLNSFGDNVPVVQVSWHEAQDFIRWLNENKPQDDLYIYRMPSESEWEYACQAGNKQRYCGSDNIFDVGWVNRNETESPREVTSKSPNAWGLYGMSGSVWQWVEDVYHDNYFGAPIDGSAWKALSMNSYEMLQQKIKTVVQAAEDEQKKRVETALTIERLRYDAGIKDRRSTQIKSENVATRVLRGGSWRFSEDFARSTYRLAGEPGNWYYGNGFRVAASLP